jgi:hypothetical protein
MADTTVPVPDESEAPDPDDRVPGRQGGATPEHHGGVTSGAEAAGDYVDDGRPAGGD